MTIDLKGKKILVVGLGRSGLAAAKYCLSEGAHVTVTDTKHEGDLNGEVAALTSVLRNAGAVRYHLGSHPPSLFTESDLVVLSPGVPADIEGAAAAKKRGIPVICELELGLAKITSKVVAITGTNGKSTTTSLVRELLSTGGKKVWVGGNIGRPLLGSLEEAREAEYVVLEVSSYQLELTPSLKPWAAVWLNVTPDHMDRYKSFENYVKAKAAVGWNQTGDDWIIYNSDDLRVTAEVKKFKSRKIPFSSTRVLNEGGWYEGTALKVKIPSLTLPFVRGGWGGVEYSVQAVSPSLMGLHNMENSAAAALTAALCGLSVEAIEKGIGSFKGLPHRLQFVREAHGVKYFNDSKGTNVGAVVKSLMSFKEPVILIAGGQDKLTGYGDLREVMKGHVRHLFLIGEAARRMKDELGSIVEATLCSSLEEAVKLSSKLSQAGDVVLLSPACASFDQFDDFEHRGNVFVECVKKLR